MVALKISKAELNWLASVITERFGGEWILQRTGSTIELKPKDADGCIVFDRLEECFAHSRSDLPLAHWDADAEGWVSVLDGTLPAPGVNSLESPLIEQRGGKYFIHYDILGLTYWMLTRVEEIGRTDLDRHGRFPAASSHAHKLGYLRRPVVDEWLHILAQVIRRCWPGIVLSRHDFRISLSHDVDRPSRYGFASLGMLARRMAGDLVRRRDVRSFLYAPLIRYQSKFQLHPADIYNRFEWIMIHSEKHGLTSAFNFICGRTDRSLDADYEIEDPAIRKLLREIHARGHEIGLHPSYRTYRNPTALKAEAERLRRTCDGEGIARTEFGSRMHYLRWEQPTTLRALAEAEVSYDGTLSYADHAGFRCGTCFEYPAFDPIASETLKLRIRPLVAMEQSVLSAEYMGLNNVEAAAAVFDELKDACKRVHGNFTLLWHNSEFDQAGKRQLYRSIL